MLHELAHIEHMNHGPGFQKLLQELTAVRLCLCLLAVSAVWAVPDMC